MMRNTIVGLCAALLLVGCGGKASAPRAKTPTPTDETPSGPPPIFLDRIPADTPYLYVTLESTEDYVRRDLEAKAPIYRRVIASLERARESHPMIDRELDLSTRFTLALVEELGLEAGPEAYTRAGLPVGPRLAIYGVGLLPVVRIEIDDPQRVEDLIDRVAAHFDTQIAPTTIAGERVRLYPLSEALQLVAATRTDELVIALVPTASFEDTLPLILGTEKPERSIADAGVLAQIERRHGLRDMVGFVDVAALTRLVAGDAAGAARLANEGLDIPVRDPVCVEEIVDLVAPIPRLVVGAQATDDQIDTRIILETRPDLANSLLKLRSSVPGLVTDETPAVAAMGLGVDVSALIDILRGALRTIERRRFACADLEFLHELAAEVESALARVSLTPLATAQGASLIVQRFDPDQPDAVEALLFIGAANPRELLEVGARLLHVSPPPAQIGGPPVPVKMPVGSVVHVALTDRAIGIALGEGLDAELATILGRDPVRDPPLMTMHAGAAFLESSQAAEETEQHARIAALDADLAADLARLEQSSITGYDSLDLRIDADRIGLVLSILLRR